MLQRGQQLKDAVHELLAIEDERVAYIHEQQRLKEQEEREWRDS